MEYKKKSKAVPTRVGVDPQGQGIGDPNSVTAPALAQEAIEALSKFSTAVASLSG